MLRGVTFETSIDRLAARLLEGGLPYEDYRRLVGLARAVARRTGQTVEQVLAARGIPAP